jgi:signal transduction histidine kinase
MTELTLDTDLTREQREFIGIVKSSADSLLSVINDILDFSKIEAGKLELDSVAFNLCNSLDDTIRTLALRAHQKGLELICRVADDVPEELIGDPGRLGQIILNLVGNAIKFTDAGEVVIKAGARDGEFHLSVRDTGPGISAADQAKLFQEFQQAENPKTRKKEGTGLGLAISKRIVEMHGGRIWIESQLGQGSTFFVTMPVQVAEQVKTAN